ncbi:MAG: hypothetical protein FWF41_05400 [Betaproteobacteria bacterium]|nr:hypothetical protein [Betaproteobacteria bacterium]
MKKTVYTFVLEANEKTYRCERLVTGTRTLYQTIHVVGVGEKSDPLPYGQNGRPIESMKAAAIVIAGEIIRENP